ncbi:exopolysaccharide Pel transporter PelG [Spirochaeta isovalerica]|uniref:Putative membrane protein n=1 Tax=Spirochaeta isovalerica TaxID=150 RepID=A0A841RC61_9SPIO|nr:exopolysaccharide Pel transporter PelG [Spirochaeta isovalerica]MBB6480590.1 putative membrane protein [Spirochaeta isovalerica]
MAGIGFELQKVLKGGGLANVLKVTLAGIVIVAGPWLISIVAIFFLNRFASFALAEGSDLFMAAIVYTYAFSLSVFGGLHYIFTRYISDMIFIRRERRASSTLMLVLVLFALMAGILSAAAVLFIRAEGVSYLGLYRFAAVCLFVTVNLIWLVMIFITLLKKYMTIFLVYLSGMAFSFIAVYFLGGPFGIGGALAGFTAGQILILLLLLGLIVRSYKPVKPFRELKPLLSYFRRFRFLFLSGVFYSAGIWVDKITLWFLRGSSVRGTWFSLFETYDIAVYFANLTIIPGLVYFMIFSETNFYSSLRKFLLSVEKGILTRITEEKYKVIRVTENSLYEQSFFQGVISFGLIILAPHVNRVFLGGLTDTVTLRLVLGAAFFHIFYLTTLTFLFYIEMYREAFFTSLFFFAVNFAITASASALNLPWYGIGYLSATILSSLPAFFFLKRGVRNLERRVYGSL